MQRRLHGGHGILKRLSLETDDDYVRPCVGICQLLRENKWKQDNCQIKIFPKTYLRGISVRISTDVPDLSTYNFTHKLSSLKVIGPCCWDIFENAGFTGTSKRFGTGEYKSSTMLGMYIFQEASSLRRSEKVGTC